MNVGINKALITIIKISEIIGIIIAKPKLLELHPDVKKLIKKITIVVTIILISLFLMFDINLSK